MLQVIKAEDVRDGEPRWWCPDDAYAARTLEWIVTGNLHTEWRRDADAFTLAIVDRPAPTPTPAPGLDLDAVERAERAMTPGPWRHGSVERHHVFCSEGDRSLLCPEAGRVLLRMNEHFPHDSNAAGIVALRNAAPALIAEVRRLRALVDEREGDMHARIRAGYDKTVADAWRAEVAKRDAEIADLRALVESQRRDYETRRRHATDARWMPWRRGIPPVRPSARLVPAAEADADPNQRGPLLAATAPVCPGPDCPMCNGEACDKCNPGPGRPRCDHDGQERHEPPTATPRCSCTHEAGDSRCNVHPTCSECGASTTRPVDGCEACRGPLPKGG